MANTITVSCPACSHETSRTTDRPTVYVCERCGCLHGRCYLGDSYTLVKPFFTTERVPHERQAPYDLDCLGSQGMTRRHGFYDTQTRLITQVG